MLNVSALDVVCYCTGLDSLFLICLITRHCYALDMTLNRPDRFAPDCRFGRGSCCGARQPRGVACDEWPLRPTLESTEQHWWRFWCWQTQCSNVVISWYLLIVFFTNPWTKCFVLVFRTYMNHDCLTVITASIPCSIWPMASSSDAFVVVRTSIVIVLIKCLIHFPIGNVGDLI